MKKVNILEVTLRDGSYAIDYAFTAADTEKLCHALEDAGFEYIEIGHGVGLNASESGYGTAAATDQEYMEAAQRSLKTAKYGMFCIPGIGIVEDLDLAHDHGMKFVRIGTNVTEVEQSEAFIKRAKQHGMFVAANYMKSYVLGPDEFAENVKISEGSGADMVYIVDSAGSMYPADVRRYYEAIRKVSDIPVGFHGHDNLKLAMANSLEAADMGISFVDSSLQGIGRSAGNTSTEELVANLGRQGYETGIDLLRVLGVGQELVRPILPSKGRSRLDIVSGHSGFHSSYMPLILEAARKHRVDPALLITRMCEIDQVSVDPKSLEKEAARIQRTETRVFDIGLDRYVGGEQEPR